jgi:ribonuclease T2
MRLSVLSLTAALSAVALHATAAPACAPPAGLTPAPALTPRADEVVSGVAIAYYVLALNWTPEWCRSGGSGATSKEMECATPHGFTLHGLWPDGAAPPYPRFCHPAGQLDAATVRQMYCRTPSAVLLQHEWQAHGTCAAWPGAKAYFSQASQLFDRIVLPKLETIPKIKLTAGAVRDAFAKANPWVPDGGIYVQAGRNEALTEVRFCYDKAFKPIACPGGAGQEPWILMSVAPSLTGAF